MLNIIWGLRTRFYKRLSSELLPSALWKCSTLFVTLLYLTDTSKPLKVHTAWRPQQQSEVKCLVQRWSHCKRSRKLSADRSPLAWFELMGFDSLAQILNQCITSKTDLILTMWQFKMFKHMLYSLTSITSDYSLSCLFISFLSVNILKYISLHFCSVKSVKVIFNLIFVGL